ncbi:ATP-binding protein [Edaphosphingomonas haloaromaticamans]|uniref:histidine kinase n=1 Tax=Edaphosphingomonas haloaromaticamans TaxID=653954 RepID=A0A1S1HKM7_9SPHN|nr:ATP-binding protein [Sphingomonas haloaromaticamans]OHT21090.1 Osmolarity sensor protein EnvZ [Sphingomonas haloaromaticamans]
MLGRPSLGLLGRIVAIILLTVTIEFAASTLLYERASEFSIKEDEARRLAEHLVIVHRLIGERPPAERPAIASYLSTDRYGVHWQRSSPEPRPLAPELRVMRDQVVEWEPALARSDLRLQLASPGRHDIVVGTLTLEDGTWIHFKMHDLVSGWSLQLNRIVLALVPAIALAVLGGLLVRRTLRPLNMLGQAAERIGRGESAIVREQGPREVRNLIRAFNRMQEQIQRMFADRTQALAAVGHDLRTPLARLQLRLEGAADRDLRHAAEEDVAEMEAMIGSLLAYLGGENDPEPATRTDLAVLLATLVDDFGDAGAATRYEGPDHLEVELRPNGIKRAAYNLIDNAHHHGDDVVVSLAEWPDAIVLRVEDNGPGIPPERMAEVLQPFARLDPARSRNTKGLGLGLAIVQQMVAREKGSLTLSNRAQGGLRAEIVLPKRSAGQQ